MMLVRAEVVRNTNSVMVKDNIMKGFTTLLLLLGVLLFTIPEAVAQGVSIREHGNVRSLMNTYTYKNKEQAYVKGWRIQIITTSDRREMERAQTEFGNLYPDMVTDWQHRSPYYMLKTGAFRDKLDYQGFLLEVKENFPSATPVLEQLRKDELLRY